MILGKYFISCKLAAVGHEDIFSSRVLTEHGETENSLDVDLQAVLDILMVFVLKLLKNLCKKLWIVQHAMYIRNSIIRLNHFLELKNFPMKETPSIHCFLYIAWVGTGQV